MRTYQVFVAVDLYIDADTEEEAMQKAETLLRSQVGAEVKDLSVEASQEIPQTDNKD